MKWLILILAGCSGAPSGTTYYRDIKPLADQKCVTCHQEGGIAPFALTDHAGFVEHADKVKVAVENRVMPPWLAKKGCTDYFGDRSLSDEQIALVVGWIKAGAPEGEASQYHALTQEMPQLSRVDATLTMGAPYTPKLTPDEYRCFLLDWKQQTTQYITGFRARPGDARIVHHVIAFYAPPADVPIYQKFDDDEAGPGYTCFGGAGGGQQPRWLGSWAPGSLGTDFVPGTGLKIEPGSKVILQVHYNTMTTQPAPDETALDFKLDAQVEKEAVIQPFTNIAWVTQHTMEIPAGNPDVMYNFALDLTPYIGYLTDGVLASGQPLTIWGAGLHMHQRGVSAVTRIQRLGGADECMLDIPRWDFHWQGSYGFKQPKTFQPGDKLYLECHWDNSAANQPQVNGAQLPPATINWGEGTGDEMCLSAFYLTQ